MHSLGSAKAQAVAAARVLNSRLIQDIDIAASILSPNAITLQKLIEKYEEELLPTKEIGKKTKAHYERRLNRFKKDKPSWIIGEVTIGEVAEYLDANFVNDSYIKHRSMLSELFNFSQNKGYRSDNPVEPTLSKSAVKKQRQRLKLNEYQAIHAIAPEWKKIARELALISLPGRL